MYLKQALDIILEALRSKYASKLPPHNLKIWLVYITNLMAVRNQHKVDYVSDSVRL
jgi:hypothetical protein